MSEGWMVNSKGNWVWVDHFIGVRATVYRGADGLWGAIWNGAKDHRTRRLKGKFEDAQEAQSSLVVADLEGELSDRWWPPDDEWLESKKGGYYRKINGAVISVKRAKSGSWYVVQAGVLLGRGGSPAWFATADQARTAADEFATGRGGYSWVFRQ
jgi:hypothetical protein